MLRLKFHMVLTSDLHDDWQDHRAAARLLEEVAAQRIAHIRVSAPAETDKKDSESSVDEPTTSGAGSANPHDGDE